MCIYVYIHTLFASIIYSSIHSVVYMYVIEGLGFGVCGTSTLSKAFL